MPFYTLYNVTNIYNPNRVGCRPNIYEKVKFGSKDYIIVSKHAL